jgi:hypothetical protein
MPDTFPMIARCMNHQLQGGADIRENGSQPPYVSVSPTALYTEACIMQDEHFREITWFGIKEPLPIPDWAWGQ